MNIKELQIKKAFSDATNYILRKGKVPSFSQINDYVKKKFETTSAGLPSFKPLFGKKYECSNPTEYNYMLARVKSDLDDLYDADNVFNNDIISSFNYYDTEKKVIDNSINDIQNRLDNLLNNINEPSSKDSIFDNFDDFSKIDFIGDSDRNISRTTSYIDLYNKVVSSDIENTRQIPLNNCSIVANVIGEVIDNYMVSDIRNCISDSLNKIWMQKITTATDTGTTVRLLVELPSEVDINTVKYYLHSPRKSSIKLTVINSNKQAKQFREISTRNNAEWNFKTLKAKVIVFDIIKSEPDSMNGVNYEYFIGAKRISLFNNSYQTKSVLVSNPYPITKPFSIANCVVDQILPPQTSIKYFIGLDGVDNQLSWMKLNEKGYTELNLLPIVKANISQEYSPGFGTSLGSNYIIAELKHIPVQNTSKLYIGNNMWEVRSIDLDGSALDLRNLISSIDVSYHKMDNINYKVPSNTAKMFTTYIYCNKPSAVKVTSRATSDDIKNNLYVNSIKIEQIDNYYTVRLSEGWNQVQMLYVNEGAEADVLLNAYFNDISEIVRAVKEPAEEISIDEMIYNSHNKLYDKFAIVDGKVIVNYDPIDANLETYIEYRYTDKPEVFENASIRVMAVLESSAKDVTPKLNNYKITTM